ncbi:MAG: ATP-binding protein [Phycisphaerae bacterium]|nr:ATP-binding protein [Phycisphaerae bacterium]MDW8263405.1 AAA family ATPase [Phycisphaerales bacterium]
MVPPKYVLTGGPGAGKSVIVAEIVRRDPRFVLVPEAATQVYRRLGTTWDRLDLHNRRAAQRQIYRLQLEQEARIAAENPGKTLLLDRGTIDGATYWPEGPEDYWRDLRTSLEAELSRYTGVIWMQTAAVIGIYDGAAGNEVRFEREPAAIESGRRLLELWGRHPQVRQVDAYQHLDDKITAVAAALREMMNG